MPNLVGIGLSQVPTNSMLGGLAYQSPDHASIKDLDLKNLSQINSEISDTAVDVFVYDTRKDSDGGAWRKRTQHTSWYNETLGTATRGTRKEFPAVAVIVAESNPNKVTIYDGDDPDLPMWMVFNASTNTNANFLTVAGQPLSSIFMLNGELGIGFPSGNQWGLNRVNFLSDSQAWYWTSATIYKQVKNSIAERNLQNGYYNTGSGISALANARVNDIAMTVLPNAPVDSATGLSVPTIALATNGGVSVIKDDGNVWDDNSSSGVTAGVASVEFVNDTLYYGRGGAGGNLYVKTSIGSLSANFSASHYYRYQAGGYGEVSGVYLKTNDDITVTKNKNDVALFGDTSLVLLEDKTTSSLVAYVTTSYNTGWMHGDIKGTFLSDTDTTNITGSEKIANYNFAADFSTQWEAKNNATTSYDATNDRVTVTSTQNYSGIRLKNASLPTLTQGKRYIMTVDIHSINNPIRFGVVSGGTKDSVNSTGSHTLTFTAGASITEVFVEKPTGSNSTFVLNSVSIREAEEDRSVNNKGLQVFGTVTKSAVATGAELVAYSGFSASNYLQQPYNSDLLFGTDDFCITGWVNNTAPSNSVYEDILTFGNIGVVGYGNREPGNWLIQLNKEYGFNMYYRTNSAADASGWSNYSASGNFQKYSLNGLGIWYKITIVKSGDRIYSYTNDDFLGSQPISGSFTTSSNLSDMKLTIGYEGGGSYGPYVALYSKLALWRISRSTPSAEQVKKMYEDEKHLFEDNSKATLYGSSDAVTALGYDDDIELLHVGTSSGRSDFQGLRRINNTTTAVTTAISAHDEFIVEQ